MNSTVISTQELSEGRQERLRQAQAQVNAILLGKDKYEKIVALRMHAKKILIEMFLVLSMHVTYISYNWRQ